ncbi:hypothetical protein CBM2629_A150396 [Cupriavidus taiwanensis]|nr:hypothetical protein CBM2629_A150396 [Cupriavidus taiwanensis]
MAVYIWLLIRARTAQPKQKPANHKPAPSGHFHIWGPNVRTDHERSSIDGRLEATWGRCRR